LISPGELEKEGLLKKSDLKEFTTSAKSRVDFKKAIRLKTDILDLAYTNFQKNDTSNLVERFNTFMWQEAEWLEDFSLFTVLKKLYKNKPWHKWPDEMRKRIPKALAQVATKMEEAITRVKWEQFIISQQWSQLKNYCTKQGVSFIGDLPFYVSHDSADVWANQHVFKLTKDGEMKGVAGVPPDYFNSDGQYWGMPVYNWDILAKENYEWWIQRLKKNIQLLDVVRLDHFRAFADYWEIPASEKTAKKGKWVAGPGEGFFKAVDAKLEDLPFIAEDLGDINDVVIKLRDQLSLPGMKILQFAFGGEPGKNAYLPHNYKENFLVYTGTHDNNTTAGWFAKDISKEEKRSLLAYVTGVDRSNIHEHMIRLAYQSVARIAIVPMQDVLGLGQDARMNTPASTKNNWGWRMTSQKLDQYAKFLRQLAGLYNR
jgi:4-alpha-glucanotransferase